LRDFNHAIYCLKNELWKPCVALCGGIIEGVLGVEFSIEGKFEKKIREAKNRGILSEEIEEPLAQVVRLFRNFIHIEKEIKKDYSILKEDANISIQVVKKIFRMIKRFKAAQLESYIETMKAFNPNLKIFEHLEKTQGCIPISAFSGQIKRKPKEFIELVNNEIFIPCGYDELKPSGDIKKLIEQRKAEISQLGIKVEAGYKLSEKAHKSLKKIKSQK